ncbi:NAD(P)/FAD-dependent oxidoreductase [Rhodopseudomonas sp. P2A-2r]|uniref:NAD(P)/FAD-dependent oxidoreductase n=1 Tax=Rhodopseudomonas sp. P2A-2r TaxID=2991972 RepID=UPI0029FF4CF0|nr:FAD-dependent oxidoreductase [Rhodopseudomonas sp. P2A-2r]
MKEGNEERLYLRNLSFYHENRISLLRERRVTALDRREKRITLDDGRHLDWDILVLATGTRIASPPIKGVSLPGVHALRSIEDARRLRSEMATMRRAVVIGGGFIGLEFAAVAREAGIEVSIVESAGRLMARAISPQMSTIVQQIHCEHGVSIFLNRFAASVDAQSDGRVCGVSLSDGCFLPADCVILATGVIPNTELAEAAGLSVRNGIVTDRYLTTADPTIHAVGDCAAFPDPFGPTLIRLESVQAAVDHGRCLAEVIVGRPAPYAALPWFWSDQGKYKLQIAGLAAPDDTARLTQTEKGGQVVVRSRNGLVTAVETLNAPAVHMSARKLLADGPARDIALSI